MNAAMSASVVLASRLPDDVSVFALMLFSIQMFAFLPILRTRLLVSSPSRTIVWIADCALLARTPLYEGPSDIDSFIAGNLPHLSGFNGDYWDLDINLDFRNVCGTWYAGLVTEAQEVGLSPYTPCQRADRLES